MGIDALVLTAPAGGLNPATDKLIVRRDGDTTPYAVVPGTAALKTASGTGNTLVSVSGSVNVGHMAVFSDVNGTVGDGGAPGGGSLPTIANGHVVANASGGAAVAADTTVTALLDAAIGTTRGGLIFRNSAAWVYLAPGTNGQVLQAGGAGADLSWATPAGGSLPSLANGHVIANASGSTTTAGDTTVTALLDAALGSTRGNVLYRGAAGWSVLAPGTSGNVLSTGGVGADPSWAAPVVGTGSGTVNAAGANLIAWYPATAAAVAGATLSALIDNNIGATQGTILYRDAGAWLALPTGTSGQFLKTNGVGANPAWASPGSTARTVGIGSANGSTQGTATALTTDDTIVTGFLIVGSADGVKLRTTNGQAVLNRTGGPLKVYPPTGGSIEGGITNAAITILPGGSALFETADGAAFYASGSSTGLTVSNIYTASGAIALTDTLAIVNSASQCDMTLANPTTDGQRLRVHRYGAGVVTVTLKLDGSAGAVVAANSTTIKETIEFIGVVGNATLGTTWIAG